MPKVNPVDRWFFALDAPDTPTHVAVMMTFAIPEGAEPDFVGRLVADMREIRTFAPPFNYRFRVPAARRFAPSLVELPDDAIDLDYHLQHTGLAKPGGERELGTLVSRLFSRPLDPNKPPWEVHIIEGLENNRFAWMVKISHGLMDGVAAMRRFEKMLTTDPATQELLPIWSIGRTTSSSPRRHAPALSERLLGVLGAAREVPGAVAALAKSAAGSVREVVAPSDPAVAVPFGAPDSVLNGRVGQQRRFATQSYDLERIKAVASGLRVTVNDVFLAICSGGLRRYLDELGELPDSSLTVGMPVSVRAEGDQLAGNAISAVLVKLRTDIEDPIERIKAIAASSRIAKKNLQAMPKAAADLYGVLFLGPMAVQQLAGVAGIRQIPLNRQAFNLLVSNVPGWKPALYMRGARMEAGFPLSIVSHGQALNISVGSMSGKFNLGFLGCRDTLPHLQRLAVYTGDALAELEKALAERGAK